MTDRRQSQNASNIVRAGLEPTMVSKSSRLSGPLPDLWLIAKTTVDFGFFYENFTWLKLFKDEIQYFIINIIT